MLVAMKYIDLPETDSTQEYAKKHLDTFDKDSVTCITSEYQSSGRGPRRTAWHCPKGKGLLLSYVVFSKPQLQFAQIACLAIAKTCIDLGLTPTVKWPNDVLISHKKLAGCMAEVADGAIVIGIGLNVLQSQEELGLIDQPATSLSLEYGKSLFLHDVRHALSTHLENLLPRYISEGFIPFYEQYKTLMRLSPGDTVYARIGDEKCAVFFDSLQEDGRIKVRMRNNTFRVLG